LEESTFTTVPSVSAAVAVIVIFVGEVNAAPLTGFIIITLGGRLLEVTVRSKEMLAVKPSASVTVTVTLVMPDWLAAESKSSSIVLLPPKAMFEGGNKDATEELALNCSLPLVFPCR